MYWLWEQGSTTPFRPRCLFLSLCLCLSLRYLHGVPSWAVLSSFKALCCQLTCPSQNTATSPEVPESPKESSPPTVKQLGCTTGQALSAVLGLGSADVHTEEELGPPQCARPLLSCFTDEKTKAQRQESKQDTFSKAALSRISFLPYLPGV